MMRIPLLANSPSSQSNYDPFQNPPSLLGAITHYKSTLVGIPPSSGSKKICSCCYRIADKTKINFSTEYQQLGFLGTSTAMYFLILKTCLFLLVLIFVPSLIYLLFHSPSIKAQQIAQNLVVIFKMDYSSADYNLYQKTIIVTVMMIALFLINRFYLIEAFIIEKNNPSLHHFAVKIKDLPACEAEDLKVWLYTNFGSTPIAVHFAYDCKELASAFEKRQQLTIQMNRNFIKEHGTHLGHSSTLIIEEIDKKQDQLLQEIKKQDEILNRYKDCFHLTPYKFVGVAFVVFEDSKVVQKMSNLQKTTLIYKGASITIENAPNPKDIIWNNLCLASNGLLQTVIFVFVSLFSMFLIIEIPNLIFQFLAIKTSQLILIFRVSLTYLAYHLVLHIFIQVYTKNLECQSYTSRQIVEFYAYSFFGIVFSCILPYSLGLNANDFITCINILLVLDAFIHLLQKIINFKTIWDKILLEYINHLKPEQNPYPQSYFNRLIQGRDFRLGQIYHYLFRGMFLTTFFAGSAPFACIYYAIAFMIDYCVQKYLLLNYCKTPPKYSRRLSDSFISILIILPYFALIGDICKLNYIEQNSEQLNNLIYVVVGLLPFGLLFHIYFRRNRIYYETNKSYSQLQREFTEFYDFQNQINKYNGQLKYMHKNFIKRQTRRYTIQSPAKEPNDEITSAELEIKSQLLSLNRKKLINRLLSYNVELQSISMVSSGGNT